MPSTCRCFCGSTPEPAAVSITNTTVNMSIGDSALSWVVDPFDISDSVVGLGLNFFLSFPAAIASEVIVYIDNVAQEVGASYSIPASLDRVTLTTALDPDAKLIVRYLAYQDTTTWMSQTLRLQDSASLAGIAFTLAYEPDADATTFVFKNGALQTLGVGYTRAGAALTLLAPYLTAGQQLVVTYAR